jgi:hypothetical protein
MHVVASYRFSHALSTLQRRDARAYTTRVDRVLARTRARVLIGLWSTRVGSSYVAATILDLSCWPKQTIQSHKPIQPSTLASRTRGILPFALSYFDT